MDIADEETQVSLPTIPKKKRWRRRRVVALILLGVLLGLVLGSVGVGATQYQKFHADESQAEAGLQHLRKAQALLTTLQKNPLDTSTLLQAQQEFSTSATLFTQVGTDLRSLPGATTSVPVYGSKLAAALHVLPIALEVSQSGVLACQTLNVLATGLRNPMSPSAKGLTTADLNTIQQNVSSLSSTFNLLVTQINGLQPSDLQLDPSLSKYVATFRQEVPQLQGWLSSAQELVALAPMLLGIGKPTNYLVEMLDSTELRPGGGFIGNYGIVTLANGRVQQTFVTDIDLIDKPYEMAGHTIAYPAAYTWFDLAPQSWSLRDSNLDADFPTAARYGEQIYAKEGGTVPVQGVIAITPWLLEHLLMITGPINMQPVYNETITAQNLVDRIHFHQLGKAGEGSELIPSPDGHSSLRKRFTAYLAEDLLARVRQLPPSAYGSIFNLLVSSLHAKDIQIYLNSKEAEGLLQQYQLGAAIQAPAGDSFFVVDSNISPNKANDFITYTSHDQVTIDSSGNAHHHTTLSYSWSTNGQNYGSSIYRDYARVYVPPGSVLQSQSGWQTRGTSRAFGREVWAGFFTLTLDQTQVITFDWTVPHAATKDAQGWHYHYLIQKQAGDEWKANLQVSLPSCAANVHTTGGLLTTGKQRATFAHFIDADMSFGVDYSCS